MQAKERRWTKLALICVAALTAFFVAVHQVNGHMVELRAGRKRSPASLAPWCANRRS